MGKKNIMVEQNTMVEQKTYELLKKVHFLNKLPGLEFLAEACEEVSLKPEEILFSEGDPGDAMYIIMTGGLKVFKKHKVIACRFPGEHVGEMALLGNNYRSASIKAMMNTTLLKISDTHFHRYLTSNPDTLMTLLKTMSTRSKEDLEVLDSDYGELVDQQKLSKRLKRILDDATNDIYVLDPNNYGIVEINSKAGQNNGHSLEDIESLKLYDLFEDVNKEEFLDKIQPLESHTQSLVSFEAQIKRKNKTLYP
jgi:CRP-like cAMP-binding protein|tara:strand:+ start:372 stop:1127 length:756 start_codon:yes stop_codon:yes gene_type:complete